MSVRTNNFVNISGRSSVFRSLMYNLSGGWMNMPADWSDIRKDCPVDSIALYAGVKSDYSAYDNLGFTAITTQPFSIVGSAIITNGIASNFSSSNYIKTADALPYNNFQTYNIQTVITTGETISQQAFIGGRYNQGNFGLDMSSTGKPTFIATCLNQNSSTYYAEAISSYTLSPSTTYKLSGYIDMSSKQISIYVYDENDVLLDSKSASLGASFTSFNGVGEIYIGYNQRGTFLGTVNLNETYIELNNKYWLAPYDYDSDYKVYIDEVLYGTYASGAQCSITWSTSGITTGDDITTPEALKAHKIWIVPATEGNTIENIIQSYSSSYQTGLLWAHFNLTNQIAFTTFFATGASPTFSNRICKAFTAKNNKVFVKGSFVAGFWNCLALEYIPDLDLSNANATNSYYGFRDCKVLKKINIVGGYINPGDYYFSGASLLKKLPKNLKYNYSSNTAVRNYVAGCVSLEDTYLDMSEGTRITRLTLGATQSVPLPAIKGLRVSNEGLFSSATAPQIDVSYTGMDRAALVQLFNDLPTVSDGQIINITGTTGSEDLTMEDIDIADSKGWTITGGRAPVQLYAYTDENNNTVYTTDATVSTSSNIYNDNLQLIGNPTSAGLTLQNFTNNGCTITDGVLSNFSSSNYATLNNTLEYTNGFEMYFKVKTGGNTSTTQAIIGSAGVEKIFGLLGTSRKIGVYYNSSHIGTNIISASGDYWVALKQNSGTLSWFTDDGTHASYTKSQLPSLSDSTFWREENSYASEDFNNTDIYFGYNPLTSSEHWTASIDMNNTFFIVDTTRIDFTKLEVVIGGISYERDASKDKIDIIPS